MEGFSLDVTGSTGGGLLVISQFNEVYIVAPTGPTGPTGLSSIAQLSWVSGPLTFPSASYQFLTFGDPPSNVEALSSIVMASEGETICMYVHVDTGSAVNIGDSWTFELRQNAVPIVDMTLPGSAATASFCVPIDFAAGDRFSVLATGHNPNNTINTGGHVSFSLSYV
jgi:hypothetical protein